MRLIRDGEKGGRGYGGVGRERLYTYRYTVTTRMTSALKWAAMRAILMFHNCEGQSQKTASIDQIYSVLKNPVLCSTQRKLDILILPGKFWRL